MKKAKCPEDCKIGEALRAEGMAGLKRTKMASTI
jgi:hypothetical protein